MDTLGDNMKFHDSFEDLGEIYERQKEKNRETLELIYAGGNRSHIYGNELQVEVFRSGPRYGLRWFQADEFPERVRTDTGTIYSPFTASQRWRIWYEYRRDRVQPKLTLR